MKLISWNVNGLRACVQKGFLDIFKELDADMFVFRKANSRKGRSALNWKVIISTGIMR